MDARGFSSCCVSQKLNVVYAIVVEKGFVVLGREMSRKKASVDARFVISL